MIRWLPILLLLTFAACEGTMSLDDDSAALQDGASALAPGADTTPAPTSPADTTPAPTTPAPTTTPTTTPPAEPEPEVPTEPDPEPEPEEPALPELGSIVEFQISPGTGGGAWNTSADAVVVYVGQVLRITNFDDRDHTMHAADNAAVDHGNTIRPGQSEDHVVTSPQPVGTEARMWDHGEGRAAAFWVEARDYPTP